MHGYLSLRELKKILEKLRILISKLLKGICANLGCFKENLRKVVNQKSHFSCKTFNTAI